MIATQEAGHDVVGRRNLADLQSRLDQLHPADVAYVLENLPLEDRMLVWGLVRTTLDPTINAIATLLLALSIGSTILALKVIDYRR